MDKYTLIYDSCSMEWEDSMPLGNGSMGAMSFGGAKKELIQMNLDTLWSGSRDNVYDYDYTENLPVIRKLIDDRKYVEARDYVNKNMLGRWTEGYLPLGDISITFGHGENAENYRRTLNMREGFTNISYTCDGVGYSREYFCSAPHDCFAAKLSCDRKNSLDAEITLSSLLKNTVKISDGKIVMLGKAPSHTEPSYQPSDHPIVYDDTKKSVEFAAVLTLYTDGKSEITDSGIRVTGADSIVLYLAAKTDFYDVMEEPNPVSPLDQSEEILKNLTGSSYGDVRKAHAEYFSKYMDRVDVSFDETVDELSFPDRLKKMRETDEPDALLANQLFQFGRYLLLSSASRSQATPLQAVWNPYVQAPWSSNYTININTEMNYWAADSVNMTECYDTLYAFLKRLTVTGVKSAKALGCRGWTCHHNTDLYGQACPVGRSAHFAFWPFGGAWLSTSIYQHYLYTGDRKFLEEAYRDILKGCAQFLLDWCYTDTDGRLATAPSTSPENTFVFDGERCCVSKSTTMDLCIAWQIFTDCVNTIETLGLKGEDDFLADLKTAISKIPDYTITDKGTIQEWSEDFEEFEVGHRHLSHLTGLYPGTRVNCDTDTELLKAHEKSLERRFSNKVFDCEWSTAWTMCLFSRLRNQDAVGNALCALLKHNVKDSGFTSHPPLQADGNFGYLAGFCEMLLQSHNPYIELLPALPGFLNHGSFRGLKARGGFTLDAEWKDGTVVSVQIVSNSDKDAKLKINGKFYEISCKAGKPVQLAL